MCSGRAAVDSSVRTVRPCTAPDTRCCCCHLHTQQFANMVWPLVEKVGGPKRVARAGGAGMTPAGAAAAADTTAVA